MEFLARLRNLLVLAYLVPSGRVLPLLPTGYEPEPFGQEGNHALVSTLVFSYDPLRPAGFRFPRLRFHQVNYRVYVRRVYVRRHEAGGVYFLRMCLSGWEAAAMQALTPVALRARRFCWRLRGEEIFVRAESSGRVCEIAARRSPERRQDFPGIGDRAQVVLAVTHALRGFLRLRSGRHLELPVEHALMDPDDLTLEHVQLEEWVALGVLTPEELRTPVAAFFQPEVEFRFLRPRLA